MSEPTVERLEPADAALLDRLRPLVEDADPVPAHVIAGARAAHTWLRVDAELAELAEDSLGLAAGVRGGAARLLTYRAGDLTVEIEVSAADDRVRILGQVVPARPTRIRVEQVAEAIEVTTDELGRFRVTGLAAGSTRLRCTPLGPDGEPTGEPVHTQWTLL